ncbi:glycosyltransferase family 2 protein [Adlercreutzia sp. ZJ141]|uniref:glycosyltransferase family 2 protein n=1 Tax=Adlercreutzia sp. ZJ141 TaxID=2709406 RepID=UPI0013EC592F|nr:glycosyltransferase family 2 protein [Adlercreutzia sp. ZJ141]
MIDQLLANISFVDVINTCMFIAFSCCYAYQLFYVLVVLTKKPPEITARRNHKYAVIVAARNERAVIGDLMRSIRAQNYPQELIDIFVVADNCTDDTAQVAQAAGATKVFTRKNAEKVGKGYALEYGIDRIRSEHAEAGYEAYFVFDADNVLDENYFREMNKTFDGGAKASTSYRNSKNFASNWISAGYAVWFLREAKFLSQARLTLNTSCAISGTGFFIAAEVIEAHDGWQWFLLTEDIEFSTSTILDGDRISYCPTAVLYDEQPITFRDSWNQRFRWAKGFYQVFWRYGARLAKGMAKNPKGSRFACYDMLMTISPAMLVTFIVAMFNLVIVILGCLGVMSMGNVVASSLSCVIFCILNYVMFMFLFGVLTTIMEWDVIRASTAMKIRSVFTFPLFMLTYIPIAFVALFKRAEWKPIRHSISVDVSEYSTTASTGAGISVDTPDQR